MLYRGALSPVWVAVDCVAEPRRSWTNNPTILLFSHDRLTILPSSQARASWINLRLRLCLRLRVRLRLRLRNFKSALIWLYPTVTR